MDPSPPVSSVSSLVRRGPHWPWREVEAGLREAFKNAAFCASPRPGPGHVLVTWNCYGEAANFARKTAQAGGIHVVAENGYLRRGDGWVALGWEGVNGRDRVPDWVCLRHGRRRLEDLGLALRPWRRPSPGQFVLVCGQRGGGYNEMAMKDTWPDEVIERLLRLTKRPIVYRPHPGRPRLPRREWPRDRVRVVDARTPLEDLLRDAFACVVHTSNAATEALLHGVPVVYTGPAIALASCACAGLHRVQDPATPPRKQAFDVLVNRQWNLEEIRSGEAWRQLMQRIGYATATSRSSSPEAAAS